jgi:hypothetical protein
MYNLNLYSHNYSLTPPKVDMLASGSSHLVNSRDAISFKAMNDLQYCNHVGQPGDSRMNFVQNGDLWTAFKCSSGSIPISTPPKRGVDAATECTGTSAKTMTQDAG